MILISTLFHNFLFILIDIHHYSMINSFVGRDKIIWGTWDLDLPEDKLEILFILKLPFSNPYNPIVQAKIESYIENNLDPFMDYQLSESILKLKQGMGRLIRRQNDAGICILSDPRILNKRYGKNWFAYEFNFYSGCNSIYILYTTYNLGY